MIKLTSEEILSHIHIHHKPGYDFISPNPSVRSKKCPVFMFFSTKFLIELAIIELSTIILKFFKICDWEAQNFNPSTKSAVGGLVMNSLRKSLSSRVTLPFTAKAALKSTTSFLTAKVIEKEKHNVISDDPLL